MSYDPYPLLVEFQGNINGEAKPVCINAAHVVAVYPLTVTADKTGVDVVGGSYVLLNEKYIDVKKALIGDPSARKRGPR